MNASDEGGGVRRAGVEECRGKSCPRMTLKPNTRLRSRKTGVSARPLLMGDSGPACVKSRSAECCANQPFISAVNPELRLQTC